MTRDKSRCLDRYIGKARFTFASVPSKQENDLFFWWLDGRCLKSQGVLSSCWNLI